jgi:DNA-binding transcriptional regulator YbjK
VADQRTRLLDAALELVAEHGLAGLTHDAVDATARVAVGSTQQWWPTRQALIEGVADRCIEREQEMVAGPDARIDATPEGLAAAFGRFVTCAVGPDRDVTLARYALQVATARDPSLRASYAVGADTVDTWALDLVRRAGSRHPERDFGILANYATGLVFHEMALPSPDLEAAARIRAVIDTLGWAGDE